MSIPESMIAGLSKFISLPLLGCGVDRDASRSFTICSPFGWIRRQSSIKVRGTIGEQIVSGWFAARGFNVSRSESTDADRIIENKAFEIKFAMLGKNDGFVFNQFRDQKYDAVILLGVCPFDAHCWVLKKSEVIKQWQELGNIKNQHNPRKPGANTGMLTVKAKNPPSWLAAFGGTLREGLGHVSRITGFKPVDPLGKSDT